MSAIALALSRSAHGFSTPVRLLIVERDQGSWWSVVCREESHSERAEVLGCLFGDPLQLQGLDARSIFQLAVEVLRAKKGEWNGAIARAFLEELFNFDPQRRPLFIILVASYFEELTSGSLARADLIRYVLDKEEGRRRALIPDTEARKRMENLLLLATLVGGLLPKDNSFDFIASSEVAKLLPEIELIDEGIYRDFAGASPGEAYFAGLQPDILGERYLLDRLSASGVAGQTAKRLLLAAWAFQPRHYGAVVVRTFVDYAGNQGLCQLFDLPTLTSDLRSEWGDIVGDLMAVTPESSNALTAAQFQKLITVSDSHQNEGGLQTARARAEYNLAGICYFGEGDAEKAALLYDAAIVRAGPESPIGIMAIHNREILRYHSGDLDGAQADFTVMIDSLGASDERRASALNNRADVLDDRGDHQGAIRDRSALLALTNTTGDRRYIALLRRSHAYFRLGNDQAGLDDLNRILGTPDITPHQKAEARIERATYYREHEHLPEARIDLGAVINAAELFPGTRAVAYCEMAVLEYLQNHDAEARMYLDYVDVQEDARKGTQITARFLRASLLDRAGDAEEARLIWQSIIEDENAPESQKEFARDQIRAATEAPDNRV